MAFHQAEALFSFPPGSLTQPHSWSLQLHAARHHLVTPALVLGELEGRMLQVSAGIAASERADTGARKQPEPPKSWRAWRGQGKWGFEGFFLQLSCLQG